MTEQEYINATDLAKLRSALNILKEIVPENSTIIPTEEFKKVRAEIFHWEIAITKNIMTSEDNSDESKEGGNL
jgi:small-conductance mechanosensitive channel